MATDLSKYPKDWDEIRERILDRDGHKCKFCKVPNYALRTTYENGPEIVQPIESLGDLDGFKTPYQKAKFWKELAEDIDNPPSYKTAIIVLTIAHLDHDAENHNVKDDRLAALCQRCHNRYDAPFRKQNRKKSRIEKTGQQELF